MIFKNKKKNKDEKGFVILIAIMVSLILLSIGIFIASVSVREIMLSSSAKQSQAAFFAADSVLECALFKEFKDGHFRHTGKYTSHDSNSALKCNGKMFDWDSSSTSSDATGTYDIQTHVYYVTFVADNVVDTDTDGDGLITKDEIEGLPQTADDPYVKLIVEKSSDYNYDSRIQVFGHNFREGNTIIERAIELVW